MQYGFNLEWRELPEELREQKIDEYLNYLIENRDLIGGEAFLEDKETRKSAERYIETHFPLYF